MRSRMVRVAGVVAGAVAIGAVAGCGSEDSASSGGGDDKEQIAAVAAKAITTKDPEVKCVEAVTTDFVTRVYGTLDQCRKAETPKPDDQPKATGADVQSVAVDGDTATARVTVQGGASDKAGGTIRFARAEEGWKVDDLDVTFLRSQLAQGFDNRTYTAKDGPLADPAYRACVLKGLGGLDDAAFKEVAFKAIADDDPDPRFVEVFSTCEATVAAKDEEGTLPAAPTKVRAAFESGLRRTAEKNGATEAQVTCLFSTLRRTVPDTTLVREFGRGRAALAKATNPVTRQVKAAISSCGAGSSSKSSSSGKLSKAPTKVRAAFEANLLKTASKTNVSSTKVRCIIRKLRSSTTDAELVRGLVSSKRAPTDPNNPLAAKVRAAGAAC